MVPSRKQRFQSIEQLIGLCLSLARLTEGKKNVAVDPGGEQPGKLKVPEREKARGSQGAEGEEAGGLHGQSWAVCHGPWFGGWGAVKKGQGHP